MYDYVSKVQSNHHRGDEELDPRCVLGSDGLPIFIAKTMDDIDNAPDIAWMIDGILQLGSVSIVYCESGTGKSFFAMHTGQCIARGMDWFGHRVSPARVLYFYVEASSGAKVRQQAWNVAHGVQNSPNFTYIDEPIHLVRDKTVIKSTIKEYTDRHGLVVIDTWAASTMGISRVDPTAVIQSLEVALDAAKFGRHVMLIHHTNSKGLFAGAMAFKDVINTMIELKRDKHSDIITVHCEKQKEADEFTDFDVRLVPGVQVGVYPSGKPITSCYLVATNQPSVRTSRYQKIKDNTELARAILKDSGDLNVTEWKSKCFDHGIKNNQFHAIKAELERCDMVTYRSSGKASEKIYSYKSTDHEQELMEQADETLRQMDEDFNTSY